MKIKIKTVTSKKNLTESLDSRGDIIVHTVEKGEYVLKIVSNYCMKLSDFTELNPEIKDLNKIFVGQKLKVKNMCEECTDEEAKQLTPAFKKGVKVLFTLIAMSAFPTGRRAEEFEEVFGPEASGGRPVKTQYRALAATGGPEYQFLTMNPADGKRRIGNFTDQIEPLRDQYLDLVRGLVQRCPRLTDDHEDTLVGYEMAASFFLQDTSSIMGDLAINAKYTHPDYSESMSLFGKDAMDIFDMSLLELVIAYGVDVLPKDEIDNFAMAIIQVEKQVREKLLDKISPIEPYYIRRKGFTQALATFKKNPQSFSKPLTVGRSRVKESKNSALDKYISENKQLLKEDPYNTPEYDLQRRANSYLTSIAKEMYKVTKPFEEIKKLIDAIPEWVEKQMPDDAWNSLGDLYDLSKINFQKLEIDFNRTDGPGAEVEDIEGQENVAGATDSSLRESLFQEEEREVPTTDGGTQTIDLDTLSDEQRFRAYTILRQNNYEFTDIEQVDYMQMLDDRSGDLTDGETNYILNNTTMSQETDLEPDEE